MHVTCVHAKSYESCLKPAVDMHQISHRILSFQLMRQFDRTRKRAFTLIGFPTAWCSAQSTHWDMTPQNTSLWFRASTQFSVARKTKNFVARKDFLQHKLKPSVVRDEEQTAKLYMPTNWHNVSKLHAHKLA